MSKLWREVMRRRNVLLVVVGLLVAAPVAVGIFDVYARHEVRERVADKYFANIRSYTADAVKKEWQDRRGCDVDKGVEAADEFLNAEHPHMKLTTIEPKWGWQVRDYQFTLKRRDEEVASFQIDEEYLPVNVEVNLEFEEEVKDAVCRPACGKARCRRFGR